MILQGLDMMNELPNDCSDIIQWIYNLHIITPFNLDNSKYIGFRGSIWYGNKFNDEIISQFIDDNDCSRLAFTYSALVILLSCGDDLSKVDKKGIIKALKLHQTKDGKYFFNII